MAEVANFNQHKEKGMVVKVSEDNLRKLDVLKAALNLKTRVDAANFVIDQYTVLALKEHASEVLTRMLEPAEDGRSEA